LNALVQSYRDITEKKDAVEVNELFKWYWDTYDTGEARKGAGGHCRRQTKFVINGENSFVLEDDYDLLYPIVIQ
jgi:hypothetical protein